MRHISVANNEENVDMLPAYGFAVELRDEITNTASLIPSLLKLESVNIFKRECTRLIEDQDSKLLSHNIIMHNLPTVKKVEPPSGFEAFLANTSDFLDATVGTLVGIVADGLATVAKGVGEGVGAMFNLNSVMPIVIVAVVGFTIFRSMTRNKKTQDSKIESKVPAYNYENNNSSNNNNNNANT